MNMQLRNGHAASTGHRRSHITRAQVGTAPAPPPAWPARCVPPEVQSRKGPKKFSLLGSTGSIGTQTLDIIAEFPDKFELVALAAGSNIELLAKQVRQFKPKMVAIKDGSKLAALKEAIKDLPEQPELLVGDEGAVEVAGHKDADSVVTGIVGCAGLLPTVAAIKARKEICLANKETLIAGGPFVLPLAKEYGVNILPADSEHSAIFQCMQGLPEGGLRRIILTASGGAFRDWPAEKLKEVTVQQAITHPNWSMGKKITIDSATLMNKGLEVIEAHYLFGVDYDNIDIVIHPQSIIHSMIETQDSSVLAQYVNGAAADLCGVQLGWPDMRLPIMYTIEKYPAMDLAYAAGRTGGSMTGVLSAANEQSVQASAGCEGRKFLDERISYLDIMRLNEACCEAHKQDWVGVPDLDQIVHYDAWARQWVREKVASGAYKSSKVFSMAA
ncbi:hypothetical protein QJQ45_029430 [Haematococcus lacustris]|nr:hypothetical protein QJQ45_029430 [Haematococcus lacustris]